MDAKTGGQKFDEKQNSYIIAKFLSISHLLITKGKIVTLKQKTWQVSPKSSTVIINETNGYDLLIKITSLMQYSVKNTQPTSHNETDPKQGYTAKMPAAPFQNGVS